MSSPRSSAMARVVLVALTLSVGVLVLVVLSTEGPPVAAAPNDCAAGNVPTTISVDTTLSGDLFMTDNATVNSGATLTLTAGTHVTMCGEYDLRLNGGSLHAEGTAVSPIIIEGETPVTRWGRINFIGAGAPLAPSTLRYVILDGGGGSNPNLDYGTIQLDALNGTDGAGPVLEHVTVRNSGAYGIAVRVASTDDTPPLLSSLTISNSVRAPVLFWASAVGGLGTGNVFTGNGEQAIEVRTGTVTGGVIVYSQTWQTQPVPYHLSGPVLDVGGTTTPALTLQPGTILKLDPDLEIRLQQGRLNAEGTAAAPITFERADPAQPWHRIFFNGAATTVPISTWRHVILDGGGGSNPLAEDATVYLSSSRGTEGDGPVMDAVTVTNSSTYGFLVRINETDPTPMRFSNLTVTGSARAPIHLWASAAGGLGPGNALTGNAIDAIEVMGTGLGGGVTYDASWRAQSVPYRLLNLTPVGHARSPVLTIEPGTTLEITPTASIRVNSGGLVLAGTPTAPITVTRVPGAAAWDHLFFEANINPASRIAYANVMYGGTTGGAIDFRGDALTLDHVTVSHAVNAGLYSAGTFVQVKDSVFEQNAEGIRLQFGAQGLLRRNVFQGNGLAVNVLTNNKNTCVDALGNYWGAADGPADAVGTPDACNLSTTNAGAGDGLSADVLYSPWLSSVPGEGALDASQIAAQDFWVIADGVATTTLTITARDALGTPLVGKQISLETTRGVVQQPSGPTDAKGMTTAVISSTQEGLAMITALNVTDGQPLAALAAVNFWQGGGNTAGLIQPGGAPYASPRLVIEGRPFEQGLPVTFRLPMQNTNPTPVDVEVVYSISDLGIGLFFTPVYTTAMTLQPGEAWDAPGTWTPTVTGHHCVQATVTVTLPTGQQVILSPLLLVTVGPFRVNLKFMPPDPCDSLDAGKLVPSYGGLSEVQKHIRKGLVQAYLIHRCLDQKLGFGPSSSALSVDAVGVARDYQTVLNPPAISMPQLAVGGGVTQAQADAANAVGDSAAELIGLDVAIVTARDRAQQAGEAGDATWVSRQTEAYQRYQQMKGVTLAELASQIDALLAVTQGAGVPDVIADPDRLRSVPRPVDDHGLRCGDDRVPPGAGPHQCRDRGAAAARDCPPPGRYLLRHQLLRAPGRDPR